MGAVWYRIVAVLGKSIVTNTEQSVWVKCNVFRSGRSLSFKVEQAPLPPAFVFEESIYIPPAELILFSPKIQTSFIGTLLFS